MRRKLGVSLVVVAALVVTAVAVAAPVSAGVHPVGTVKATTTLQKLRYCERPVGPGAYVAATPNVPCATAVSVVKRITGRGCWGTQQCDIGQFVCISYWSGSFRQPFSYSHHGICPAQRGRRIEFDLG
jgi:hypothetical protein